jgi:hypothetical protein
MGSSTMFKQNNIDSANNVHEQSIGRCLRRKDRLGMALDLKGLGCKVQDHPSGLLVNDKFIFQMNHKKWRVLGSAKWYWYKSIPAFVAKHVNV